ncbi:MAG: AI-2E family transporter [Gemmatimonadaceae bacterium]
MTTALAGGRFRVAPVLTATVITVLLLLLVGNIADLLILLFVSVLISLYLGAVADILRQHTGLPKRWALLVAVIISLAALAGLFWLLVPPVVEQTQALLRVIPSHIANWEAGIERFVSRFPPLRSVWRPGEHQVLVAVYDQLSGYFSNLVPKLFSVLHLTMSVFSVAVMSLYLALTPGLYREFMIALFPPVHRDLVRYVLSDLSKTLRAWIVGQIIAMIFLGALTALGLYLLDVPYSLVFGVFTGVVAIVPFFGTLVSTALPALFVLGGDAGLSRALLVAGLGVVIHVIEANVVAPLIMHRQVHLPPVLTVMAVLIMGKLLGSVGLVVAVPILAVIMVVIRRILISRIYEGQGFRRTVRDSVFLVRAPAPEGGVILTDHSPPDVLAAAEVEQRQRVA